MNCTFRYISKPLFYCSMIFLDEETASFKRDSEHANTPTAYFISLVATNITGFPEKEHYLYDIATEMELQGFRVKFLSSKDIKDFYRKHHPGFDENKVNIYDMTLFFIQMHKGSSFFLDEVPFIAGDRSKIVIDIVMLYYVIEIKHISRIFLTSIDLTFLFISDEYDASSVERLEKFLLACQKEMSDGKLWLAMQANVLSDQSYTLSDFEERYKEMMIKLENLFTIPTLNMNMRNGEKVNKACQEVESQGNSSWKVSETIDKLPPPTTSSSQSLLPSQALQAPTTSSSQEEPIFIPVNEYDFESNFQKILKPVLDLNKKTLILHSDSFKGKNLKSLLLKNFPHIKPETIVQHDKYPNDATKEDLKKFLKQLETKIGIFLSRLVTGMEGSNVIYFNDHNDYNNSVRCTMTRAVSHLCIIYQFRNNSISTKFPNMKANNNFIKCQKDTKEKFKCSTCNINKICAACLYGCHNHHQTKRENYLANENDKCKCINYKCMIQRK